MAYPPFAHQPGPIPPRLATFSGSPSGTHQLLATPGPSTAETRKLAVGVTGRTVLRRWNPSQSRIATRPSYGLPYLRLPLSGSPAKKENKENCLISR